MTDSQEAPKEVDLTDEQKQSIAWMNYVANEVNTLLHLWLPFSKSGTVGVIYNKHVTAVAESGPEYHPSKADGVELRLVFEFETPQEIPKPPEE